MSRAAILDVDGTLVDTNYHHSIAWYRAFRSFEITLPLWRIHRHIGIGSDRIVASLTDDSVEQRHGDDIRSAQSDLYMGMINEVRPLEGAHDLLVDLRARGHSIVLASSGKDEEIEHYLELLDAHDLVDAWTTSAEVANTKPEPDVVKAALEKAGDDDGVMVGDSTWDCKAATRAGIDCIGVLTGGFSARELADAGAAATFESLVELRAALDESPFE
jgi:HAD superfamily hydrolase (TIGR01509 family)